MKSIKTAFKLILVVFFFCSPVWGAIELDTLEDIGPDGTLISSREISGVTVTISTSGSRMEAHTYFGQLGAFQGANLVANAPLNPDNVSGDRFISALSIASAQPIIFDFSKPVMGFGLTTLDLLEIASTNSHFVRLEAFNSRGDLVATQVRQGPQGASGLDIHWYLSSNVPEITQVVLSSNITQQYGHGYGIDDLLIDVEPVTTNLIDATHGAGASSFELGSLVQGGLGHGWMHVASSDTTTIKGWSVGGPGDGVGWLISPTFRAGSGKRSIDLQSSSSSSISTIIPTVPGNLYELSFSAAAVAGPNYNNHGVVSAGSLTNQPFLAPFSGNIASQDYSPFSFIFTATEPNTTIRFQAVGPGVYGPVIDSVSVVDASSFWVGQNLSISPAHDFFVDRFTQKAGSIKVFNSSSVYQWVTIEVVHHHANLSFSYLEAQPLAVAPGEIKQIQLLIDPGDLPAGVYDDLLFKLTLDDGTTLYSALTIHIVEPEQEELPDLTLRAEDIRLADYTLGESATLSAVIHNTGKTAVSDVPVEFYEFGTFLGQTVVPHVPANGSATATFIAPITTQGERIVQVVIDPFDEIQELNIANNEASQVLRVGESIEPISGHILVTGSLPSTIYTDNLFPLRGKAVYDIFVNGVRYTDYVVKGGTVEITIQDEVGNEWVYGGVHTNVNGNFSKTLQAPSGPGAYTISLAVTDKTFVGKRNLMFAAVERPSQEPSPPPSPTSSGSGQWIYSESTGTWSWTWTTYPTNEPMPQSDLYVFSENIHFTNNNPAPGEETTIFAKIQYWAEKSDMIAENVPINFYATYPGTPRLKIAETIIDRISVGAPDFGGRFVYASMRDWQEGIYLVEVEIDPSYIEENQLNNAATRALIVGQLQSFHGAIAGQVLDAWGGVEGVQLRLYGQDGQQIGNALTGSTGHYHFDNLPVGEYTVHILAPQDYRVDAETKATTVQDQAVSEVGFQLQQEEPAWDAIEDLTARVKDGKVQLVWTHLLGTSLYEIHRGTSSGGPYVKVGETTSDFSTYLDQDVVNGTTYHYIVRRLWGADSSDSNEASATPTTRVRR